MADAQLTILDEVGARLANVTIVNGYRFDLIEESIKRASLIPFQNGDLPAVNYWPTVDLKASKENGVELKEFNITIEVYDVTRDEPFTDLAIKRGNDIATALFRSTSFPAVSDPVDLALGGLVSEIGINSLVPIIGEGSSPWCGALLDVTVKYNAQLGIFDAILDF